MKIAQRLAEAPAHHGPVIATVDGYDVIECEVCGFRHIDPLFTDVELKKFYEQEFYESERPDYFDRMEADKEWWMLRYHHYYGLLEAHAPISDNSRRRILDIGSGPGYFLESGRERGWQVLGFEPSSIAADYARARGLAVVNDFFTAAKAREHGPFDAISLSMVLEHVRDPVGLIEEARNLLVPGGLLLLISPNDFNPLQMTLWKQLDFQPWWVNPKHHLNYFDTVSASRFLKARRFDVLHLETSYPLENFLLAGRNYVGNPALGRECHNERKAFESTLFRHDKLRMQALAESWAAQGIGREFVILGEEAVSIAKTEARISAAPCEGADLVLEAFLRHQVKHVFIFPGGTIAPILDRIEKRSSIEIVCPRTEQGAGYAALGYARMTGETAVFMVTSGPGVTNAVTPVADAYYDNIPLVVITGQVGTGDMRGDLPVRQRGFQEVDTVDLMRPITKAVFQVTDIRDLPDVMEQAFFLAGSGRQGPVVVDLPMNVQRGAIDPSTCRPAVKRTDVVPFVPADKIETLAQWISAAERPVILAGGGVIACGAYQELRALADKYRIPVTMSMPGMGAYPSEAPLSLGLCGYAGSQYANMAMYKSDLLIGIGTTFHLRQTGSLPAKTVEKGRVARIDLDINELRHSRVPLDMDIHADAKAAMAGLDRALQKLSAPRTAAWLDQIAAWKAKYPLLTGKPSSLPKPQEVIAAANSAMRGKKVIVTTGVGQHQVWVPRHFDFDAPGRVLLTSSGHGTMGFDLPAAIGAKIAEPDACVICFVGDGSLQMNIQELATIVERGIDIKIVVLDNHALSIVAQFQRQNWKSHPSTGDKYNPDFAAIAQAYGIAAVSISLSEGMADKFRFALNCKGPVLIHCQVDPEEDLLPMLLGGHTLDDMFNESSF